MPISLPVPVHRISQLEFGDLAFEVMRHVFDIHNEIGRFFDERIYKRELAYRLPGVQLEVPIDITFDSFHKQYFLDMLVGDGGVFEFKAVDALVGRHRAQLMQYLLLCDVAHGKLINVRPENVEHEFVNSQYDRAHRTQFDTDTSRWHAALPDLSRLQAILISLLRDLGTGLEIALYEEAIVHFFGGPPQIETEVAVEIGGRRLGFQRFRQIAPGVALKITAFDGPLEPFEIHAWRLLKHIDLNAIAWVNIGAKKVTFTILEK